MGRLAANTACWDEGSRVTGHGGIPEALTDEVQGPVESFMTGKLRRMSPLQHLLSQDVAVTMQEEGRMVAGSWDATSGVDW